WSRRCRGTNSTSFSSSCAPAWRSARPPPFRRCWRGRWRITSRRDLSREMRQSAIARRLCGGCNSATAHIVPICPGGGGMRATRLAYCTLRLDRQVDLVGVLACRAEPVALVEGPGGVALHDAEPDRLPLTPCALDQRAQQSRADAATLMVPVDEELLEEEIS